MTNTTEKLVTDLAAHVAAAVSILNVIAKFSRCLDEDNIADPERSGPIRLPVPEMAEAVKFVRTYSTDDEAQRWATEMGEALTQVGPEFAYSMATRLTMERAVKFIVATSTEAQTMIHRIDINDYLDGELPEG